MLTTFERQCLTFSMKQKYILLMESTYKVISFNMSGDICWSIVNSFIVDTLTITEFVERVGSMGFEVFLKGIGIDLVVLVDSFMWYPFNYFIHF